jgi:hypothetical protein
MAVPSNINGIINLTPANPSIAGSFDVTGFVVNSSNTNWVAKVTDIDSQVVFFATHSSTDLSPFSHSFSPSIQLRNLNAVTSSGASNILVYTGL